MSRCWGCCQENCGYNMRGCACVCHDGAYEQLTQRFADQHEREMADLLAKLPPTVTIDGVVWNRAIDYSDGCESRCGCYDHPGRHLLKTRDGRSAVHVVECKKCGASWCVGRA